MRESPPDRRITRRDLLARLAALGLAFLAGPARAAGPRVAGPAVPWDEGLELAVTFQIGDPRNRIARRPYVAVYVERPDGSPVRTLSLWKEKSGNTWLRHLRRWHRANLAGRRTNAPSLVLTTATATRPPGRYTVIWDGHDDAGRLVEQGAYVVVIESVRQGGTVHLVEGEFTFGDTPFSEELEAEADIQQITIEYRRKGAS